MHTFFYHTHRHPQRIPRIIDINYVICLQIKLFSFTLKTHWYSHIVISRIWVWHFKHEVCTTTTTTTTTEKIKLFNENMSAAQTGNMCIYFVTSLAFNIFDEWLVNSRLVNTLSGFLHRYISPPALSLSLTLFPNSKKKWEDHWNGTTGCNSSGREKKESAFALGLNQAIFPHNEERKRTEWRKKNSLRNEKSNIKYRMKIGDEFVKRN